MKNTTKLAFSVYALTLVLATSGAYAGSYDPTCDGNLFYLDYPAITVPETYNPLNPAWSNFQPSLCTDESFTWSESATFMDTELATYCYQYSEDASEHEGEFISAWKLTGTNKEFAAGSTVSATTANFVTAPATVGHKYALEPVWSEYVGTLTLNSGGWGIPSQSDLIWSSGTSTLYVKDTALYTDVNRWNQLTTDGTKKITIPVRTGYTFVGYAAPDSGVFDGCYWGSQTCTEFDPSTCATNFDAEKCLWIDSTGKVTQNDLGQYVSSAAKITELDAVWRAHKFTVKYDITSGIPSGWKSYTTTTNKPADQTCTFGESCTVTEVAEPKSNQLIFKGWKCTSGCRTTIVPDGTILQGGSDISSVNFNDDGTVTLTAQWEVRKNPVKFYTDKSTTTAPVDTLYYVYGGYWFDSVAHADAGVASKLSKAPTQLTGATKSGYTLRGWTFDHTGYVATVESDTGALNATALVASDTGTLYTDPTTFGGRFSTTETKTVSAYGTWARNCAANLPNVATCELVVMEDGVVWYKNACDTGFHMTLDGEIVYEENMDKTND